MTDQVRIRKMRDEHQRDSKRSSSSKATTIERRQQRRLKGR